MEAASAMEHLRCSPTMRLPSNADHLFVSGSVPNLRRRVIKVTTSFKQERIPPFKAGVPVVKKIQLTMITRAGERFAFSESKALE